MTTLELTLPDDLRDFVEARIQNGGYVSVSEYVRELIREDQQRCELRAALLEGAASPPAGVADAAYFERHRARIRR